MPFEIRIPSSGELGDEITLTAWRKKIGDPVERGDVIVEIEADKGVLEIEAVVTGTLAAITVEEGSEAEPGGVIGSIHTEEDTSRGGESPGPEPGAGADAGGPRGKAAPIARRMAREA